MIVLRSCLTKYRKFDESAVGVPAVRVSFCVAAVEVITKHLD